MATDFKKRNIWPVPCLKWNSDMYIVSRRALSAIYSVPGDVQVPMDSYGTSIALAGNRYAIGDDLLWTHGAHSVRMGFAGMRFRNQRVRECRNAVDVT